MVEFTLMFEEGGVVENPFKTDEHVVGATGIEPATSCSRSKRSTKLSYAPKPAESACAFYCEAGQILQGFFVRRIGKIAKRCKCRIAVAFGEGASVRDRVGGFNGI